MKHRLVAVAVLSASLTGCTERLAFRFDCANVVAARGRFQLASGNHQVLYFSRISGTPLLPDAFSGPTLYMQLDPAHVRNAATIALPSSEGQCFVSVLRAPNSQQSHACSGRLTIQLVRDDRLEAQIQVTAPDVAFALDGLVVFQSAVLTPELHPQ